MCCFYSSVIVNTHLQHLLLTIKSFELFIYLHITYLHFSFLQNSRDTGTVLSTRQLVEFGLQISRGVSHLHSMGILHRDVSTRSCVYVNFIYYLL